MTSSKRRKFSTLTDSQLIKILNSGKYLVDPANGLVTKAGGEPLCTIRGKLNKEGQHLFVCIYDGKCRKRVGVHRLIWLYVTQEPIPPKYEIHHRNTDKEDNRWVNLFCLHPLDHDKLHNGDLICNNSDPDQLPF